MAEGVADGAIRGSAAALEEDALVGAELNMSRR